MIALRMNWVILTSVELGVEFKELIKQSQQISIP